TVRLDERHRSSHGSEELRRRGNGLRGSRRGRSVSAVRGSRIELAHALYDRARFELLGRLLEEGAPLRVDRLRGSEVLLEQLLDEAGIQIFELLLVHSVLSSEDSDSGWPLLRSSFGIPGLWVDRVGGHLVSKQDCLEGLRAEHPHRLAGGMRRAPEMWCEDD